MTSHVASAHLWCACCGMVWDIDLSQFLCPYLFKNKKQWYSQQLIDHCHILLPILIQCLEHIPCWFVGIIRKPWLQAGLYTVPSGCLNSEIYVLLKFTRYICTINWWVSNLPRCRWVPLHFLSIVCKNLSKNRKLPLLCGRCLICTLCCYTFSTCEIGK